MILIIIIIIIILFYFILFYFLLINSPFIYILCFISFYVFIFTKCCLLFSRFRVRGIWKSSNSPSIESSWTKHRAKQGANRKTWNMIFIFWLISKFRSLYKWRVQKPKTSDQKIINHMSKWVVMTAPLLRIKFS